MEKILFVWRQGVFCWRIETSSPGAENTILEEEEEVSFKGEEEDLNLNEAIFFSRGSARARPSCVVRRAAVLWFLQHLASCVAQWSAMRVV